MGIPSVRGSQMLRCVLIALAAFILFAGCGSTYTQDNYGSSVDGYPLPNRFAIVLEYFKDPNTGLCFAYYQRDRYHKSMAMLAHVPCTEKVLHLAGEME